MKTSAVLASLLLSLSAVAAPVDKRALVIHTETVVETVVVYTTVYEDDAVPETAPTPAPEVVAPVQPSPSPSPSSNPPVAPAPSPAPPPAPAPVVPVVEQPTSVNTPVPAPETPSPSPTLAPVAPAPAPEAPKPTTTEAPYVPLPPAPAPAPPAPAPAPPAPEPAAPVYSAPAAPEKPAGSGSTSGQTFSNVDITIYDNNGGFGACGTALHDTDMIVALAKPAWGESTYDVMTGAATNPWCGQKIKVDYQGNSIEATIMDLCPGCLDHDIDLSLAAWKALTGLDEKTRLKASWSPIS